MLDATLSTSYHINLLHKQIQLAKFQSKSRYVALTLCKMGAIRLNLNM